MGKGAVRPNLISGELGSIFSSAANLGLSAMKQYDRTWREFLVQILTRDPSTYGNAFKIPMRNRQLDPGHSMSYVNSA